MSGIYIPDIEMPTSCSVCWALDDYGDYPRCRITEEQRGYNFPIRQKRMDNCPLVPVPDHGRLIDADALIVELETQDYSGAPDYLEHWTPWDMTDSQVAELRRAPTILPADKE